MKIFFINLYYWLQINLLLFIFHTWAFIPVAFNDIDIKFNSFIELIPYTLKVLSPLLIDHIFYVFYLKRKKILVLKHI